MSYTEIDNGSVTSPACFQASGIVCGLKRSGAPDLAMIYSPRPCLAAAAFTSNLFAAAPVIYDRRLIAGEYPIHAVVVNSGNANACTGEQGIKDSVATAAHAAGLLQCMPEQVMVSSTGRIGVPMPMDIIISGVDKAVSALSADGGCDAARAIMTTDTVAKHLAVSVKIGDTLVTIGGMTKGAGMIAPKLKLAPPQATMLCYITTDAVIDRDALYSCLDSAIAKSFNRITVDGDTSTNDTVLALANGAAGNDAIKSGTPECIAFCEAFTHVLSSLAKQMVLDGEGVSKFVEINVHGAHSTSDAKICAEAIANSALCKTAWFGCDPNWGRILCAAGYCGIDFEPTKVNLDYDQVAVVRNGMDAGTPEAKLVDILKNREWTLDLYLNAGDSDYTIWSCDLTYDYVKINADYHT